MRVSNGAGISNTLGLSRERGVYLPDPVLEILNKYPTGDAHLYIPGAQIPVLGPELATNGDFSDGLVGWTASASLSVTDGVASGTVASGNALEQPVAFVAGRTYRVTVKGMSVSIGGSFTAYFGQGSQLIKTFGSAFLGDSVIDVVATGNHSKFLLNGAGTLAISEFTVREILSYTDRISNFGSGNFRDTAGTLVGAVDQPVARVNDAAKGLGPELYNDTVVWTALAGWVQSGKSFTATAAATGAAIYTNSPRMVYQNKTYVIAYEITNYSAGTLSLSSTANGYAGVSRSAKGRYSEYIRPTLDAAGGIVFNPGTQFSGTVTLLSVREVIGTHAQQATTANMPTLRRDTQGLYSWEFDGSSDYLQLDKNPFSVTDNFCIVAGAWFQSSGLAYDVFECCAAASNSLIKLGLDASGYAQFAVRDDASVLRAAASGSVYANSKVVLSGINKPSTNTSLVRVNGVQKGSKSVTLSTTTLTAAAIGARPASTPINFHKGLVYPIIAIKGTVSDADLLVLEKWVGKMSGVII